MGVAVSGWTPSEEAALITALHRHCRAANIPAAQTSASGWLSVAQMARLLTPLANRARRPRSAAEYKNRAKALGLL